jgi:hypothetical protein
VNAVTLTIGIDIGTTSTIGIVIDTAAGCWRWPRDR